MGSVLKHQTAFQCKCASQNWKERKAAYEQVQGLFQQAQSDDSDDFSAYGKSSSTGMYNSSQMLRFLFATHDVNPCGTNQPCLLFALCGANRSSSTSCPV